MTDLAERVLPRVVSIGPASMLTYRDRGRLVAVETPAAIYVGTLKSIIFHAHGDVGLCVERDGAEARATIPPETPIAFGT